jgi:hypothetical protein
MYRYAIAHQMTGDAQPVRTFTPWRPAEADPYLDLVAICGLQLRPLFDMTGMGYVVRLGAADDVTGCRTTATMETREEG